MSRSPRRSSRCRSPLAVLALTAAVGAMAPGGVSAHMDTPVTPDNIWRSWNLDPFIILPLLALAALYVSGTRRIWRGGRRGRGVSVGRAATFTAAMLVLAIALLSPLDRAGGALFSAHMAQHLLLVMVAAPLMVYAAPLAPVLVALPRGWRSLAGDVTARPGVRTVRSGLTNPFVVWFAQAIVLWVWHIPRLYEAALQSAWVHTLEHITFFATAALFWWLVMQPFGRRRLGLGMAVIFIFTAMIQSSALGALITFAPSHWYNAHAAYVGAWGLTPLGDQQLAGLIMWIPAGLVYVGAALTALWFWLGSMDAAGELRRPNDRVLDSVPETNRFHSPRSG